MSSVSVGGKPISFDEWLKKNQDVVNVNGNDLGVGGQNQPQGPNGNFSNPSTTIFDVSEANYKSPESTTTQTSGSGAASSNVNNSMTMGGSIFDAQPAPVDGAQQPVGVDAVQTTVASALTAPPNNEGAGAQGGSTAGNSNQANQDFLYSQYQEEIKDFKPENDMGAGMMTLDLNLSINPDGTPVDNNAGIEGAAQGDVKPEGSVQSEGEVPEGEEAPEEKAPDEDIGDVPEDNAEKTPEENNVNKAETTEDIEKQRKTEEENKKREKEPEEDKQI